MLCLTNIECNQSVRRSKIVMNYVEFNPEDSGDSEAFFFDNIRSDNNDLKLSSIAKIKYVSSKLGPLETRETIFPIIEELTKEIDEDIRGALLEELRGFDELIGGVEHAASLLNLLEVFLASDDSTIRTKATEIVIDVVKKLTPERLRVVFVPFVNELLINEWFTARMSAIMLWPVAYDCDDDNIKNELLEKLIQLSNDKITSVRRIFITILPNLYQVLSNDVFHTRIFPIADQFFTDALDTIKMSLVDSLVTLLPDFQKDQNFFNNVLNKLLDMTQDKSWRVRYAIVSKFPDIKNIVSPDYITDKLLPDLDSLLDDREPEVRMSAASILSKMFSPDMSQHLNTFFTELMWDRMNNLVNGIDSEIGCMIVEQIGLLSPLFNDDQYKTKFMPFIEKLLKNSIPEVKLKGLSVLSSARKEFNILEDNLVEGLKDMSNSTVWRVRLSLVEHIGLIASSLQFNQTQDTWTVWCEEMLQDDANAVRESAVDTIIKLSDKLGYTWISTFIENRLKFYPQCNSYLLKITTILLLQRVCMQDIPIALKSSIVKHLLEFSNDSVANVRLNITRTLGLLKYVVLESQLTESVESTLKSILSSDSDADVLYFTKHALESFATAY